MIDNNDFQNGNIIEPENFSSIKNKLVDKVVFFIKLSSGFKWRIGFTALIFILSFAFFIATTSIKVNSESETKLYRQRGFYLSVVNVKNGEEVSETSDVVEKYRGGIAPLSMDYEVDKVTPTPTPVFVPTNDDVWLKLAQCESKQNWNIDTGNGYYGGLQFSLGAWVSVGGSGKPSDAGRDEQIMRGKMLQKVRGWGAWGTCSKKLGLN